jgi:hypothetical protein
MIQKRLGALSHYVHLAHVTDVEESGRPTNGFVLFENASILDRHLPPGKIDQSSAVGRMKFTERSALQFAHH